MLIAQTHKPRISRWPSVAMLIAGILQIPAQANAASASVTLGWNANPESDIASYQVAYGTQPGNYTNSLNAGNSLTATVAGLSEGTRYYFVIKASNQAGLQSAPSTEISYQAPVTSVPTAPGLLPQTGWTLRYVDSHEAPTYAATAAFDGNPATIWSTAFSKGTTPPPHEIQIDLGATHSLAGFRYLPRQDKYIVGNVATYEFYVSTDGSNWGTPAASGTFSNTKSEKEVLFSSRSGRYIRFRAMSELSGLPDIACAEINVLVASASNPPPVVDPPVNQAPSAIGATLTTAEDRALSIMLAASDPEGSALTYSIVTPPAHGTLAGTGAQLTYTPNSNYFGSDALTFKVNDGSADSAAATINLTVTSVNDTPVFTQQPLLAADAKEGVAYTGQSLAGLAADPDGAASNLTYAKTAGPEWLQVAADGSLSGTPTTGSAGTQTFSIRASDAAGAFAQADLTIKVIGGLPLPWVSVDIGSSQLLGSINFTSGVFTQAGAGSFGGTSDSLRLTYQMMTGDGEITAQLSAFQNTGTASRVGIMIRESLAPSSKHMFIGLADDNDYRWVRRTSSAGSTSTTYRGTGTLPNVWLRLVRTGSTLTSYRSADGKSWTNTGSATFTMASTCYAGLVVSSGSDTLLNTSKFTQVNVTP